MGEIAREVARAFGVKEENLYLRFSPYREARSVFMKLCCRYLSRGMSFSEIGRGLGDVGVAAVSQCRKRLEARMKEDGKLRKRVEDLKTAFELD